MPLATWHWAIKRARRHERFFPLCPGIDAWPCSEGDAPRCPRGQMCGGHTPLLGFVARPWTRRRASVCRHRLIGDRPSTTPVLDPVLDRGKVSGDCASTWSALMSRECELKKAPAACPTAAAPFICLSSCIASCWGECTTHAEGNTPTRDPWPYRIARRSTESGRHWSHGPQHQ